MNRFAVVLALVGAACTARPSVKPGSSEPAKDAAPAAAANPVSVILDELQGIADTGWWPGFDVLRTPLAIYDGERTYLAAHPSPPEGFVQDGRWHVFEGRHPALVANNAADIGGTLTAGVLLPPGDDRDARAIAQLLVHEAFHVYQRTNHPTWIANEAVLLELAYDDPEALGGRALENHALQRALAATAPEQRDRWIAAALRVRERRFEALGASGAEYERASELNEGLARYVEWRASGDAAPPPFPDGGFAAEALRDRSYVSGASLAILLDAVDPGWKTRVDAPLDRMLARIVPPATDDPFTPQARQDARALGVAKAETYRREVTRQREAFESLPAPAVVVEADPGAPLQASGFDPLNVLLLGPGDVLHGRYVGLGNDAAEIEVLDLPSRTRSGGGHPLFGGVQRFEVRGVENLEAKDDGETTTITGDGLRIVIRGGGLRVTPTATIVTLPPP